MQLYTVPVQGGVEEPLPIPTAARATYSPDGARIAYNPLPQQFLQWKQYRGGMVAQIWLYTSKGHAVEKIPQPASRANDTDPMWLGDTVYFRSDRNGEFNLFAFNTRSKQITQLTRHTDFPVLYASAGNGRIIYEQAGSLHILETQNGTEPEADDRRRLGSAARPARASSRARGGFATPTSRPQAHGRCSSSAGRS